jgi:hypothetical protein
LLVAANLIAKCAVGKEIPKPLLRANKSAPPHSPSYPAQAGDGVTFEVQRLI